MDPKIRKAMPDDIPAVREIEREGQDRWSESQFAEELRLAFSTFIVLVDDTGVIGFAIYWNVAGEIQLNNIGVKRERRRAGLGTLLMEHLVSSAEGPGMRGTLFLDVSALNRPAIEFYRKCGFVETGRRRNYYDSVDAILMERAGKC
jgi:[ribosomal protein S18]-alanine N-acetyltransferase